MASSHRVIVHRIPPLRTFLTERRRTQDQTPPSLGYANDSLRIPFQTCELIPMWLLASSYLRRPPCSSNGPGSTRTYPATFAILMERQCFGNLIQLAIIFGQELKLASLPWLTCPYSTVRLMLSTHPWCTWPLHVKLFTDIAVKGWKSANDKVGAPPLPQGFTCAIELEGVDGKSGQDGSGREGPISVDDGRFPLLLFFRR